jgi:hypothetical protein
MRYEMTATASKVNASIARHSLSVPPGGTKFSDTCRTALHVGRYARQPLRSPFSRHTLRPRTPGKGGRFAAK